MPDKLAISTYGRDSFKKCRILWDFTSSLRLGYTTDKPPYHFTFGSAWHAAMEVWYEPGDDYQTDARLKQANVVFEKFVQDQYREIVRFGNDSPELDKEYESMLELAPKMLEYYAGWAQLHDDFEPVTVEHEFEVHIGWVHDGVFHQGHGDDYVPCEDCIEVVYTGRIDGLARDYRGFYWVLEQKSAAKESGQWWLQINSQVSSYEWATKIKLGIPIKGTIYTIAYKRSPEKPGFLKDGSVSCDKRLYTTAAHFLQAIEEAHPFRPAYETITDDPKYFKYHQYLTNKETAPKFIERKYLHRNPRQLENVGRYIAMEAEEMLSNPKIYPTDTSMNCNACAFRAVCLNRQDGGDWEYQLASEFPKREDK